MISLRIEVLSATQEPSLSKLSFIRHALPCKLCCGQIFYPWQQQFRYVSEIAKRIQSCSFAKLNLNYAAQFELFGAQFELNRPKSRSKKNFENQFRVMHARRRAIVNIGQSLM